MKKSELVDKFCYEFGDMSEYGKEKVVELGYLASDPSNHVGLIEGFPKGKSAEDFDFKECKMISAPQNSIGIYKDSNCAFASEYLNKALRVLNPNRYAIVRKEKIKAAYETSDGKIEMVETTGFWLVLERDNYHIMIAPLIDMSEEEKWGAWKTFDIHNIFQKVGSSVMVI